MELLEIATIITGFLYTPLILLYARAQGCFAEMGVDVPSAIRHFGGRNKIHFAHFRNVRGSVHEKGGFQEVFHDDPEGELNMIECMKAYYKIGFEGPMRPDHAPKLIGDNAFGGSEGYHMLGKVYSLGYMKGLAQSIEEAERIG